MKVNALMMDEIDNIVTCVTEVAKGEDVVYQKGSELLSVRAEEDIPYCHKIALKDFDEGDEVLKYGELIGKTNGPIAKGHLVNHENIHSVPRDYDSELVEDTGEEAEDFKAVKTDDGLKFWGYRRAEGRPGIRNHVLILPTCACGSESSRIVASQVRGAVNIVFNTGCSDVAANTAMSQKILTGFACNPNVYGVVIIGLGCETVPHKVLREKIEEAMSHQLNERERRVLEYRYGLADGNEMTLEEVAKVFGLTKERIRQIEAKALRKLRHPGSSRQLKDYFS